MFSSLIQELQLAFNEFEKPLSHLFVFISLNQNFVFETVNLLAVWDFQVFLDFGFQIHHFQVLFWVDEHDKVDNDCELI